MMATLSIRNLPDDLHQALRERAARHGHSMEAEARRILAETLKHREQPRYTLREVQEWVAAQTGTEKPQSVVDEFLSERRAMWGED